MMLGGRQSNSVRVTSPIGPEQVSPPSLVFRVMAASAASVKPVVTVRSGPVFVIIGSSALIFLVFSAVAWAGASAMNDVGAAVVSGSFLLVSGALLAVTVVARKNTRLFANEDVVGSVGPFGGVRLCLRAELREVRVVWQRYRGRGWGDATWAFPSLHFRRLDGTDAFAKPALLFRYGDLNTLANYLQMSISLERPTSSG